MGKIDPHVLAHLEWLGFVQPMGLVISATALQRANATLDRRDRKVQDALEAWIEARANSGTGQPATGSADFEGFARRVLGWSWVAPYFAGTSDSPIPDELVQTLPQSSDVLRPDYAVRDREPQPNRSPWQLLVRVIDTGQSFDDIIRTSGFEASEHGRLERLLRMTRVPAGVLFNGVTLRLMSAPYGESAGWIDFHVESMRQTAGRPIANALALILGEARLLTGDRRHRFVALIEDSRKYQNEVSERLAEQVLHGLYEMLRGLQAADDSTKNELLHDVLRDDPDQVYRALLTVTLRLVFLLYAEERDMLPDDETFRTHYSLGGLYQRLREEAALFPDTMHQRFGAWAQLLALFRMIHDGADAGALRLPARHGVLFDPDRYKFLEGRTLTTARQIDERIEPPRIPDGTVYRVLENLLVLDGERISYRALDVEQIGSVYETMMGFKLELATGPSVAIKAQKRHGAPTAVDLARLLDEAPGGREKWLTDKTGRKASPGVKKAVGAARTLEELHAALDPIIDSAATPDIVRANAMVLQPSEARRRSGSHYTPRELTEPIVRTTLEPILERLRSADGKPPRPEAILDLKVCDPAMGSGAFLVEACRHLGDKLIESWHAHGERATIPPDEDEVIFARRLIAQRCLYGVDRNPVAVDLAKMSLWLATLAKDHPLTFVDHALRHGDSLVGLSKHQIEIFHWDASTEWESRFRDRIRARMEKVSELRRRIRDAEEGTPDSELHDLWDQAELELSNVRILGDLVVAAYFESDKPKKRQGKRDEFRDAVSANRASEYRTWVEERREADRPVAPLHWEIEFPEVFETNCAGFHAFVGNPPFAGKSTISGGNVCGYQDWIKVLHAESHGNSDLVAHFFRRCFALLRPLGTLGLVATNTIAQGDTRASGLRWMCKHGGDIFAVRRRVKWPGSAAVVVSIIHVMKGAFTGKRIIGGYVVERITAFLFHRGSHDDPARLAANARKSFQGSVVVGMGFTFDDTDSSGVASSIAEMRRIITEDPKCREVIAPYIGGDELNSSAAHAHHRYVINFGDRGLNECRLRWPLLVDIVEAKVRPERIASLQKSPSSGKQKRALTWWQFSSTAKELAAAVADLRRVIAISQTSRILAFTFLPTGLVYSHKLIVFPFQSSAALCALHARPHEIWARFFGSTMKDDAVYTPSDCFETFPFPELWESHPALDAAGKTYYEFRAALMVRNDEGMTKTYNRFHDPEERDPEIAKLRELHAAMDRAVLDAYGWRDLDPKCEFLLDYEIDEEEWGDKKKPWRYRWSDEVQAEVLARLLELNAQRAKQEAEAGLSGAKKKRSGKDSGSSPRGPDTGSLFG
jgi:hypothetical protein